MQRCVFSNFGIPKLIRKHPENPLALFKHGINHLDHQSAVEMVLQKKFAVPTASSKLIMMSISDINKIVEVEVCHMRLYTLMYRSSCQETFK